MDFKIQALVLGFIFLVLLPKLLEKATKKNAGDLIGDPDADATLKERLEGLLNWRDWIISIITGLFVLQFAAAEKTTSSKSLHIITVDIKVAPVAYYLTIFIIPFMILLVWMLTDRLDVDHILQLGNKRWWLLFIATLIPIYFLTGVFFFIPLG